MSHQATMACIIHVAYHHKGVLTFILNRLNSCTQNQQKSCLMWISSYFGSRPQENRIEERQTKWKGDDALQFENWNFVSIAIHYMIWCLVWFSLAWLFDLLMMIYNSDPNFMLIEYFIFHILYLCVLFCVFAVCLHALHFHYLSIYFFVWQFCKKMRMKNVTLIYRKCQRQTANILIDDMIKVMMQPSLNNFILWIDDAIENLLFILLFVKTKTPNYISLIENQKTTNYPIRVNKKTGRPVIWLHDACDSRIPMKSPDHIVNIIRI